MGSHEAEYLEAMHVGHVEIEHHEICVGHSQALDGPESAFRLVEGYIVQALQRGHYHPSHRRRVVDDQDCAVTHRPSFGGAGHLPT